MGYRSEVIIKVTKNRKLELLNVLDEQEVTIDNIYEDDDYFAVELFDRKWYDGYTDVDAVTSFICDLEEEGGIIRIGEDNATEGYGEPWSVDLYTTVEVEGLHELPTPDTTQLMYTDFKAYKEQYPEHFI